MTGGEGKAAPVEVVAAVIRDAAGRVLLAQRRPGGPHGDLWEFPGGKVEAGESPEEALAREIREELGVAIRVGERLTRVDHAYPHLHIRLSAYRARIREGTLRALHCQAFCWVAPERLLDRPMPEADLPVARAARADGRDEGSRPPG